MNIKNKVRSSYPSNAQGINHSIAENVVVDLTKYKVQPDSTLPVLPNNLLAERILQDYAVTCLPSHNSTGYDADKAKKDLEYLNLKLDAVRKTITSGDVYSIQGVAESEDDVDHMISVATPNTAFISNVRVEKNKIAPGDIVFTDLNNQIHIIQHAASGYFYPAGGKQDGDTNTYKLTYSWSTDEPIKIENPGPIPSVIDNQSQAYDQMSATINVGTDIGFAQTFKLTKDTEPLPFSYPNHLASPNQDAIPLITVFNEKGEKIGLDNILTFDASNDNWTLTNPTSMTIIVEVR